MADLKPCPFCGETPELRTTYGSEVVGYANSYSIRCPRCFVTHGASDRDNPKGGYALPTGKDEAFARWNRRAPDPRDEVIRGMVEALKAIDVGQSSIPDHWEYRCMARKTADAALSAARKLGVE